MRDVVRDFLALPTRSIGGSLTYQELSVRKLFIFIQRSCFQNLRLLGWEIRELWITRKKNSVATSRIRHRARARVQEGQGEAMRATLVFCFGCSTQDAATERIFLIIHDFRIFHPNNLKFWEKLLCIYMNNFPARSFLYVKLPSILFVGKVRKTNYGAHQLVIKYL